MNRKDFTTFQREIFDRCVKLSETKGHDYSGDKDALENFKRNGNRLGLSPLKVLAVYMNKHLDAIDTYIREESVKSEPIEGRIEDAITYLTLLAALISERGPEQPSPKYPKNVCPDYDMVTERRGRRVES